MTIKNTKKEQYLAGPFARIFTSTIDFLFVVIPSYVFWFIGGQVFEIFHQSQVWPLFIFIAIFLYIQLHSYFEYGQSIAWRIFRIKIYSKNREIDLPSILIERFFRKMLYFIVVPLALAGLALFWVSLVGMMFGQILVLYVFVGSWVFINIIHIISFFIKDSIFWYDKKYQLLLTRPWKIPFFKNTEISELSVLIYQYQKNKQEKKREKEIWRERKLEEKLLLRQQDNSMVSKTYDGAIAPIPRRVRAATIDLFPMLFIIIVPYSIMGLMDSKHGLFIAPFAWLVAYFLYSRKIKLSDGRSLGYRVTKMRILDMNTKQTPSKKNLQKRWVKKWLNLLFIPMLIVMLPLFISSNGGGMFGMIGVIIAGTIYSLILILISILYTLFHIRKSQINQSQYDKKYNTIVIVSSET